MNASITFWDSDDDPSGHDGLIYTWNGYVENDSMRSLLCYVETNGERLRSKYLAWIHDLGEYQINGKRVIDHLAFDDGLSYWWMTLFVEKSPWKSPSVIDVIRFFALEEIIVEQKPARLCFVSPNRKMNDVLSDLCKNLDIPYEWKRLPDKSPWQLNLKAIYNALPHLLQALIGLVCHIWVRWPLRKAEKAGWFTGNESLFVCSYFFNVDPELAEKGNFYSHFWGGLHDFMRELGISGNWLQHYYPHDAVPSPGVALKWVRRFNQKRHEQGFHTFLDAYLSWRCVFRVLKRWLRLEGISWGLGEIKQACCLSGSPLSLWPLIREDWCTSVRGRAAIDNLLWIELFDRALSDLPHQKMGLYLCENQSWERALIHAWRKHGHGQLIAVPHSTVRFWDVRCFSDPRTVQSSSLYPIPQADMVTLNGKAATNAYLGVGKDIVECEALRYNYLKKTRTGSRKDKRIKEIRVLILGDFLPSCTIKMLQLLEAAQPYIMVSATYVMKPHPNYLVDPKEYPSLNLKVVIDHLGEILGDFDIAYSTNLTSAAVDAYIAGLQVVVTLDETKLNFSPLRGQPDVHFVSTPEGLAEALQVGHKNTVNRTDSNDFFFLDPELPRWRKLLAPVSSA